MQRSLLFMTQGIGLYVVYGITFIVTLFYLITNRREYKAIKAFYMRVFGMSSVKGTIYAHRNFYTMGKIVMDRFSAYGGRKFDIEVENKEKYDEAADNQISNPETHDKPNSATQESVPTSEDV